ncbi:hypothetical protein [Thauera humireducens]|uniref:hypothetical protein n=1 Tax=Thauera humireducens TaxID=1134435 RepID=UPI00311DF79E
MLVVRADSPVKSVADLRGKTFVLPEEVAYMTRFCRAELRDKGIDLSKESVFYVREQGCDSLRARESASPMSAAWRRTRAPYASGARAGSASCTNRSASLTCRWSGHPGLSPGDIAKARQVLVGLSSDEAGQAFLRQLGITGFSASEEDRLRKLLGWLGV